jgi:hypothetical protein
MSEPEFFGGLDANADKVDPAAFEKFKERVKAAAAQIKALQAGEQKQRKKEEKLIRILLKFVKTGTKKDIMLLIARLLEQNIPPLFILSIVSLGHEDIKKEMSDEKLLAEGQKGEKVNNNSLSVLEQNKALPLKLRIEIDEWLKYIYSQAFEDPHRLIRTALDSENNIILPLVQLPAFILRDYLDNNNQPADYEKLKEFSKFFMIGIMEKAIDKIKEQKEIKEGEI